MWGSPLRLTAWTAAQAMELFPSGIDHKDKNQSYKGEKVKNKLQELISVQTFWLPV